MTDISVQYMNQEPPEPRHAFRGGRPGDDLPLSAAIYAASVNYGKESRAVAEALYAAVKSLEAEVVRLRATKGQ